MTSVEEAQQAVAQAWGRVYRLAAEQQGVEPKGLDAALNDLVRAVEARCAERLRSEGHHWSGQITKGLFQGADLIDPDTRETP